MTEERQGCRREETMRVRENVEGGCKVGRGGGEGGGKRRVRGNEKEKGLMEEGDGGMREELREGLV